MSHGATEVSFKNDYGKRLFVAFKRRDFSCVDECGGRWTVKGWIKLEPGETKIRQNPTGNQWFYYYAEAVDGAMWFGSSLGRVRIPAFDWCTCQGSTGDHFHVGMVRLDTVAYGGVRFVSS
jgi:hypothetical protein